MAARSLAQIAKMDQYIETHPEEFIASDQFRAMAADAEMFGLDAVRRRLCPAA